MTSRASPGLLLFLLAGLGLTAMSVDRQPPVAAPGVAAAPPHVTIEAVQVPAPYQLQATAEAPILVSTAYTIVELGVLEIRVRPRARQWRAQARVTFNDELRGKSEGSPNYFGMIRAT